MDAYNLRSSMSDDQKRNQNLSRKGMDSLYGTGTTPSTFLGRQLGIRMPESGDIMASRFAQRGTVGLVLPDETEN